MHNNPILQITVATKELLEADGGFRYIKRDRATQKLPPDVVTYWLLGQHDDAMG